MKTFIQQHWRDEKTWVLADQLVVSAGAFFSNLLLFRTLDLGDYGYLASATMLQLFLLSVQQALLSSIQQVLGPQLPQHRQAMYYSFLFRTELILLCSLSALWWLLSFIPFSHPWDFFLGIELNQAVILFLCNDFFRKIFISTRRAGLAFLLDLLSNGAQLLVLFLLSSRNMLTLNSALWTMGLSFLPALIYAGSRIKPVSLSDSGSRYFTYRHLRESRWLLGSTLLQWLSSNLFVLASGYWLGAASLGILRFIQYVFGLLNVLLQAIEHYALPRAAVLKNSLPELRKYLVQVLHKTLLFVLPLLLILLLATGPFLQAEHKLEGSNYSSLLLGFALFYTLILFGYPVRMALRSLFLNRHFFYGYALSAFFSVLSAYWLIRRYELEGVLAGMFICQGLMLLYWLLVLNKKGFTLWK